MNYFGISEYYRPIPEIDHRLRRRVRMCYWKQWRYARTLVTQIGMTNQWLKELLSVKELWVNIHYPTTVR